MREENATVHVSHRIMVSGNKHCGNSCPMLSIVGVMELHPVTREFPPNAGRSYRAECLLLSKEDGIPLEWDKRRKYHGYLRTQLCRTSEITRGW